MGSKNQGKMLKVPPIKIKIWIKYFLPWMISDCYYWFSAKNRKRPDFLIIGVHKGGSTSMFEYIAQHPDVIMSRRKESHFFTKYYHYGMRYYQGLFPKKCLDKMTGEATPYYFYHPLAPARIKKELPNVKIIILLRDPVLRAYSHYNMIKAIDPAKSFDEAIQLENTRLDSEIEKIHQQPKYYSIEHQTFSYFSRGLYYEQLKNWLKYFRLEDLLVLKSEDFFENPKKEMKKIYYYLGLSETYPSDLSPKNSRKYEGLSKNDYDKCKLYFKEDQEKLHQLLGDNFKWF